MKKYAHLKLKVLTEKFSYVLFDNLSEANLAIGQMTSSYNYALFVSAEEISAIVPSKLNARYVKEEPDWVCIRIIGEMPFGTVQGLIAEISGALISHSLGLCVVSTFKTDWFFIKQKNVDKAIDALKEIGWELIS